MAPRPRLFALGLALTTPACWSPPEPCSHGTKPAGLWAEEGLPIGKAAVCVRSNAEVLATYQKGNPGEVLRNYESALGSKGWKRIGADAQSGTLQVAFKKGGVVVTGMFDAAGRATSVELVKKAVCKAGGPSEKRWEDLTSATALDKAYVCAESADAVTLMVPALSFAEACTALEASLAPRGYHRRADMKSDQQCGLIKDAKTALLITPGSALSTYPLEWTRIGIRSMW